MKRTWIIVGVLVLALLGVCAGIGVIAWIALAPSGTAILQGISDVSLNFSAEASEEASFPVDGPASLQLTSQFGDITVTAVEGADTIEMSAVKTAWGSSQEKAEAELKEVKIVTAQEGSRVTISVERPKATLNQHRPASVKFTLRVPVDTAVSVEADSGAIDLSGVERGATLKTSFGRVSASDVIGAVNLSSRSGELTARRIAAGDQEISLQTDFGDVTLEEAAAGQVTIETRSGGVSLVEVNASGPVSLKSDFGKISFKGGSAGGLNAETQSGDVTLSQVSAGDSVTANSRFGSVSLTGVTAGAYTLTADSGKINADGVQGSVTARSKFGDIELTGTGETTLDLNTDSGKVSYRGSLGDGPNKLHTGFGDIRVSLPADSEFDFDLSTEFGDIRSDFDVAISGEPDEQHWIGRVGAGGVKLEASTRSGGISLEKYTSGGPQ